MTQIRRTEAIDALIVAWKADYHAQAVRARIRDLGLSCAIVDAADFPSSISLAWKLDDRGSALDIECQHNGLIRVSNQTGLWWRRPAPHDVAEVYRHPKLRNFAAREARHAFLGALSATQAKFLNEPHASQRAALKPVQLAAARDVGLRVPATIVTNSPAEVTRMHSEWAKGTVFKLLGGPDFGFFETRLLNDRAISDDIDLVAGCPTIFQEHIDGLFDLRITVVGDMVYAGRVNYRDGKHPVDSRVSPTSTEIFYLDADTEVQIRSLMRRLNLSYAAIDMRYSEELGYVFFEANPEGQYLWMERLTGHPISAEIAKLLTSNVMRDSKEGPSDHMDRLG